MSSTNNRISYMYIVYSAAFHMKFKHLFIEDVYASDKVASYPLVITWAEAAMTVGDDNNKCLAVATKISYYEDSYQVSEEFFEDALQSFFLFPDTKGEDSSKLRLEFVKALLNK